jgi:hypothetical protein
VELSLCVELILTKLPFPFRSVKAKIYWGGEGAGKGRIEVRIQDPETRI